jgi:hypothetical protein
MSDETQSAQTLAGAIITMTFPCREGHRHRSIRTRRACWINDHLKRLREETKDWPKWMHRPMRPPSTRRRKDPP